MEKIVVSSNVNLADIVSKIGLGVESIEVHDKVVEVSSKQQTDMFNWFDSLSTARDEYALDAIPVDATDIGNICRLLLKYLREYKVGSFDGMHGYLSFLNPCWDLDADSKEDLEYTMECLQELLDMDLDTATKNKLLELTGAKVLKKWLELEGIERKCLKEIQRLDSLTWSTIMLFLGNMKGENIGVQGYHFGDVYTNGVKVSTNTTREAQLDW